MIKEYSVNLRRGRVSMYLEEEFLDELFEIVAREGVTVDAFVERVGGTSPVNLSSMVRVAVLRDVSDRLANLRENFNYKNQEWDNCKSAVASPAPQQRRVLQIVVPRTENERGRFYALCEDGTTWYIDAYRPTPGFPPPSWTQLPPIPGDSATAPTA